MEKRFTISGCSTCLGIAGAILLIAAALLCGCTTTQPEQAQTTTPVESEAVTCTGGAQTGDKVVVDYIGTYDNGTEFDSSYKSGRPFVLEIGSGGAIPGFDKALHCMEVNETKKFTLSPEEAYGEYDPAMLVSMPIGFIPTGEKASVGERVTLFDGGQYFQATIADMNATNVTFDLNSPLAGKALTFEVTVRGINDQQLIDSLSVMVEPEKKSVHTNLSYEDLFRYNENYIGDMVQYSGKVIQMMEESDKSYSYRIAIDDNSDQILYAFGYEGSRVLENDNVIIIGEVVGLEKYQTVLGSQKIIPKIKASSITVTHKP